jgi:hypothetical protein
MTYTRILAIAFDGFVLLTLVMATLYIRRNFSARKELYQEWALETALVLMGFLPWLLGQWPALFISDSFAVYLRIVHYQLFDWTSSLYSLYMLGAWEISHSPGFVSVVQVIFVALAASYIGAFASSKGVNRWACRAAVILFSQLPLNPAFTIFLSRDPVFSWCHLLTALFFPWYQLRKGRGARPSLSLMACYALLVVGTGFLRIETIAVLPVIAVLLYFVSGWSPRMVGRFGLFCAAFTAAIYLLIYVATNTRPLGDTYAVVSMINPLSELVHEHYRTTSNENDRRIIDRVVNYEILQNNFSAYDVPAAHKGAVRSAYTHQQFTEFRNTYWKIVFANGGIFLHNRARLFWSTMGFTPNIFYQSDDLLNNEPYLYSSRVTLGFEKAPVVPALQEPTLQILSRLENTPWSRVVFASNIWALALSLVCLAFFRLVPACTAAVLVLVCRLGIVFITSPASHFKYVYGFYLLTFFLPLLVWAELKQRGFLNRRPGARRA